MIAPIPKPGPKPRKPRKPLKRTAPQATSAPRRSKLAPTNPERKRERHMRDFDGGIEHDHFVREKGCALRGLGCDNGPIQAAHIKPRSTGGRWWQIVGLCAKHHRLQEEVGNGPIEIATGIDLAALAKRYVLENLKEKGAI
ncbi:MAG: hypothetical protein NW202_13320 [Nitrospira sp.]|nr:hypothetical protein [Nitrospira sp.]